jgi:hypothetical protein
MKPESIEALEMASPVSWLPVDLDVELTEALFRVGGNEAAQKALGDNLSNAFKTPVLRPLLEGALAIFGRSPAKMLKWTPKVWSLVFRDVGTLDLAESHEDSAVLVLQELPPAVASSRNYLLGIAAAVTGFFDAVHVNGSCRLVRVEADRAELQATWTL